MRKSTLQDIINSFISFFGGITLFIGVFAFTRVGFTIWHIILIANIVILIGCLITLKKIKNKKKNDTLDDF